MGGRDGSNRQPQALVYGRLLLLQMAVMKESVGKFGARVSAPYSAAPLGSGRTKGVSRRSLGSADSHTSDSFTAVANLLQNRAKNGFASKSIPPKTNFNIVATKYSHTVMNNMLRFHQGVSAPGISNELR